MTQHLFFASSVADAETILKRIRQIPTHQFPPQRDSAGYRLVPQEEASPRLGARGVSPRAEAFVVVSSSPEANRFFEKTNTPFTDSGEFFPRGKWLRSKQEQIATFSRTWAVSAGIETLLRWGPYALDEIGSYSLSIYLAEVEHSLLVADRILTHFTPTTVHVSSRFTEWPFRRYQSERLNLEHVTLDLVARSKNIVVHHLETGYWSASLRDAADTMITLFRAALSSVKQLTVALSPGLTHRLTIIANYYHAESILPLLRLLRRKKIDVGVIGKWSDDQRRQLESVDASISSLESLLSRRRSGVLGCRLVHTLWFLTQWWRNSRAIERAFSEFNPLYWSLVKRKITYLFLVEFPFLIECLDAAAGMFSRSSKTVLTLSSADVVSRALVSAAITKGARVIELQHGLVVYDEEYPFRCHHVHAIWGPVVGRIMGKHRFPPSTFTVTGFPPFDRTRRPTSVVRLRRAGRTMLGLSRRQKVLLILSVFPVAADRLIARSSPFLFLRMVVDASHQTGDQWVIVVRSHPSYRATWIPTVSAPAHVRVVADPTMSLAHLLSASDVIVSNFTTATVEAMFFHKPILLYSFGDPASLQLSTHPLVTTGATALFETTSELSDLLDRSTREPGFLRHMDVGQQQFLKQYCSVDHGSASRRVVDLLARSIRSSS